MTIGDRIREAREAMRENGKRVSRARFVDLMENYGVRRTEKALYNWETGFEDRTPGLEELQAISKVTGRSVQWYLTGDEEKVEEPFELRKWLNDPDATFEGRKVTEEDKKVIEALFRRFYSGEGKG